MDKERLLLSLAREAGKSLPSAQVESLVAEAREHLEDSIQARLELGLDPEEAEREAISAFGNARRVAQEATSRAAVPCATFRNRLLAAAYALFIIAIVGGMTFLHWSELAYHATFVLGWLTIASFALVSFRDRRPAPIRTVSTGLIATLVLWTALGTTWLNLYPYGGTGMTPRGEADSLLAQCRHTLAEQATDRMSRPEYHPGDSARAAQNIQAVAEAQADPRGNFLSFAPETFSIGAGAAAAGGAIDLVFGGLGALVFALKRRLRGGGLRA